MRILEIIEELIIDEKIDVNERSAYGFIRFIIGTRFRAFDARRESLRNQRSRLILYRD